MRPFQTTSGKRPTGPVIGVSYIWEKKKRDATFHISRPEPTPESGLTRTMWLVFVLGVMTFTGKTQMNTMLSFAGESRYEALVLRANLRSTNRLDHKLEAIKWRTALRELRQKSVVPVIGQKA
jgi:hypothetical protein